MKQYVIPLSLYIHFPWCVQKCPYCDFNSHALRNQTIPEQAYIEALIGDLKQDLIWVQERPLQSIFMGGGTPSLFSGTAIKYLLDAIRQEIAWVEDIEITLEANPGTIDQAHFAAYRAAGVNRLSLGVQSLQDDKLNVLGRIHDQYAVLKAVDIARQSGFDNFNIDLMFGLPQQTTAQALDDLRQATELQPTHLSWYQLTIEPNTVFYKQTPTLPEDELLWEMTQVGQSYLQQQGFMQYEVSAYSRQQPCRHNLNYWQFGDYLGLGAGAHAKVTDLQSGTITRLVKYKQPTAYIQHAMNQQAIVQQTIVSEKAVAFEFMLNALRLVAPIDLALFEQRTGMSRDVIQPILLQAEQRELINLNGDSLVVTDLGKRFLNDLQALFL
ncbi:MAG: radical SAM family heme chaperone HemW [Gammaproteobacteria bacterium]